MRIDKPEKKRAFMKSIFCIEADWEGTRPKRISIAPMLECMSGIYPDLKCFFRTANTLEELTYCLNKFNDIKYDNGGGFYVVLFAAHGQPGMLRFGDDWVSLDDLVRIAIGIDDEIFYGDIVHFDACHVMKVNPKTVREFMVETGAGVVTGFNRKVGMVDSVAFAMILVEALRAKANPKKAVEYTLKNYADLCNRLKFKALYKKLKQKSSR